jgi:hypothetical protein
MAAAACTFFLSFFLMATTTHDYLIPDARRHKSSMRREANSVAGIFLFSTTSFIGIVLLS